MVINRAIREIQIQLDIQKTLENIPFEIEKNQGFQGNGFGWNQRKTLENIPFENWIFVMGGDDCWIDFGYVYRVTLRYMVCHCEYY